MAEPAAAMPEQHLAVWRENRIVGRLWQAGPRHTLVFAYEWTPALPRQPISHSLPLREEPHEGPEVEAFFGNLLPEGDVRSAVARALRISERNDYALLEALGGDCAGALILMPLGVTPPEPVAGGGVLGPEELAALVDALPRRPLLAGENGLRLSLAGAQQKLALCKAGDAWLKPAAGAISTHILKPPIRDLPGSIENEAFCMALAERCGLGVPESWIEHEPRLYVVTRFDRERERATGRVRRLHQEDFCQALGIPASRKYEAEGGPSLADCFALIRRVSHDPAGDLLRLLDWVIFNFFIGNHDAHAKNLSLLYRHDQVRLAPFYDLLCTAAHPGLSERFAMCIGGAESPRYMALKHWRQFAQECGLAMPHVLRRVSAVSSRLKNIGSELATDIKASADRVSPVMQVFERRVELFGHMLDAEQARRSDSPG